MYWLKRILILVIAFLALLAGAVYLFLPTERIVAIAADEARKATGRTLTIGGDIRPTFFPVIGVATGPVSLSNADWAEAEHMVAASATEIGVEILPLLSGRVSVSRLVLVEPRFNLEIDAEGRPNWEFAAPSAVAEGEEGPAAETEAGAAPGDPLAALEGFTLAEATVRGGAATLIDRRSGDVIALSEIELVAAFPGLDRAVSAEGAAVWNGMPAALKLTLETPRAAAEGKAVTLDAELKLAELDLAYRGRIEPPTEAAPPLLDGTFRIAAPAPAEMAEKLGLPDLPAEIATLTAVDLGGEVRFAPAGVSVTTVGGFARSGKPVKIDIAAQSGPDWLTGGRISFDGKAESDGFFRIATRGEAALADGVPALVDARVDLNAPSPVAVASWLAVAELPAEAAAFTEVSMTANVDYRPDGLDLRLTGAAERDARRLNVSGRAEGGADWMSGGPIAFATDLSSPDFFAFVGEGAVAPGAATPEIAGAFRLSAPAPAALAAWLELPAHPELAKLSAVEVTVDIDGDAAKLNLKSAGDLTRDGRAVAYELEARGAKGWAQSRAVEVTVSARSPDFLDLDYRGRAAAPEDGDPAFDGALKFAAPDLAALAAWAGAALALPPEAPGSLSVEGAVKGSATSARIEGGVVRLGDIILRGDAGADFAGKPSVTARLATNKLDLRPFLAAGESGGAAAPGGGGQAAPGWSKAPIDLAALDAVDADIALTAPAIELPDLSLGDTAVTVRLTGGALTAEIERTRLFGGGLTGRLAADAGARSYAARLDASGLQLRPLLTAFAGTDRIEGTGAFRADLRGAGASLHDIMNSLDGDGALDLRDGALIGVNLAAMVRNITGSFQDSGEAERTDFSSVTGTFTLARGVMANRDLAFLGPLLRIAGDGEVGIGARTLNYRMTPKAVATLKGQGAEFEQAGLTFPVLITGTWDRPQFAPDLSGAIEGLLKDPEGAKKQIEAIADTVKSGGIKDAVEGGLKGLLQGATGGAPTAPAPAAQPQPTTEAQPAAEAPATEAPAAETPATEAPATVAPAAEAPAAVEPAAETPAAEAPATEAQPAEDATKELLPPTGGDDEKDPVGGLIKGILGGN